MKIKSINFDRVEKHYIVDIVAALLIIVTTFSWKNYLAHILLGFGLIIAIVVHLCMHKDQIVLIIKMARWSSGWRVKVNVLVDLFIGTMFITSLASGLIMVVYSSIVWGSLHSFTSWMFFLGILVHISLHFTWIVKITRKLVTGSIGSRKDKRSLVQKILLHN